MSGPKNLFYFIEIEPTEKQNESEGAMFKIWAKIYENDRIAKQTVYESEKKFTYSRFFNYLTDICGELDIPTPVLLKPHLFQYAKFNHVVFRPQDFMEGVSFQKLVLENML